MIDSSLALDRTPRSRKVWYLLIVLITLVLILAWPTTSAESPLWEVWVVNETGQPLGGMIVTLSYQNYSAESEGHLERKQTDANGYVMFSQRSLRASRLRRIVATLVSARDGVHAGFGPHAYVWADGNGLTGYAISNGYVTDWRGAPTRMSSRIVAHARR
jgi:hypothetical protein